MLEATGSILHITQMAVEDLFCKKQRVFVDSDYLRIHDTMAITAQNKCFSWYIYPQLLFSYSNYIVQSCQIFNYQSFGNNTIVTFGK